MVLYTRIRVGRGQHGGEVVAARRQLLPRGQTNLDVRDGAARWGRQCRAVRNSLIDMVPHTKSVSCIRRTVAADWAPYMCGVRCGLAEHDIAVANHSPMEDTASRAL
jgi:hypothetical protein